MAAAGWLRKLEKIFRVMNCTDAQRVSFSTYMLVGEAEHWWEGAHRHMEGQDTKITWQVFQDAFLDKYFPRSV